MECWGYFLRPTELRPLHQSRDARESYPSAAACVIDHYIAQHQWIAKHFLHVPPERNPRTTIVGIKQVKKKVKGESAAFDGTPRPTNLAKKAGAEK